MWHSHCTKNYVFLKIALGAGEMSTDPSGFFKVTPQESIVISKR
ncbi:hypothetical protein LLB_2990 [Legionella longbeachae D-4968]|nr:hypothetical protein LLB_2990 [Legionella longbeachae D-4968]